MRILALEFSSAQRSVAVVQVREGPAPFASVEVVETGERGAKALGMIRDALQEAQVERDQIECIAVGLGPGSYTGIRGAIALAQGWHLAKGIKLLGLSSADGVAAQARSEGLRGHVAVVIDAQRAEYYLGTYELDETRARPVQPLRLTSAADVRTVQMAEHVLVGPEVTKWFSAGRAVFPRAAVLARLAADRTDFISGEQLEPIYLRPTTFVKAPPSRILPP